MNCAARLIKQKYDHSLSSTSGVLRDKRKARRTPSSLARPLFSQKRDVWVRGRYDDVTPLLIELNWLPVSERILLLTSPMYIIDLLDRYVYHGHYDLYLGVL